MTKTAVAGTLSMTGFGKARRIVAGVVIDAQLRAVNHRYLDLVVRLPGEYAESESEIVRALSERLERGRVELVVTRTPSEGHAPLQLNRELLRQYLAMFEELARSQQLTWDADFKQRALLQIVARGDITTPGSSAATVTAEERGALRAAVEDARLQLDQMRTSEGARLADDIREKISSLGEIRGKIAAQAESAPTQLRERLEGRLKKNAADIQVDPQRFAAEVALMADRVDVSEELVRLVSHLEQFEQALSTTPVGRKLDFLTQEIGRELNTIGSKAQDAAVQLLVVDGKVVLEKIREQVQNLV